MSEIKIFKNEEFGEIRTVEINGELWFVGKDVCKAFGDSHYRRSLSNVDELDKTMAKIDTSGGSQNMTVVNESGLYSLLFQMQPQKAKGVTQNETLVHERIEKLHRFKHWVTHDVLPSIRKHGVYMTPEVIEKTLTNPDFIIRLATELKKEQEKRKELENVVANQEMQIVNLNVNNKALANGILKWCDRNKLNAGIRKLALVSHKPIGQMWNELYRNLEYRYGIQLKKRGRSPFLNHVKENEWDKVIKTFSAMCEGYKQSSVDMIGMSNVCEV